MDAPLTLTGDGYGLQISAEAQQIKDALLDASSAIKAVTSEDEATVARAQKKELAKFRTTLEKSRKAVKEPFETGGKRVDKMAKEFGLEAVLEEDRLEGLIVKFAEKEAARHRAAAELARKEAEEMRIKAEAAQRQIEELEKQAAAARLFAEQGPTVAEVQAQKTIEAIALHKADIAERVSVVIDAKPPTTGTKMEWDYEVEDLAKLHSYFPEFVELTARRSAILQYIRSQPQQLPGLRVFEKVVLK
jgi:hypothetical protein